MSEVKTFEEDRRSERTLVLGGNIPTASNETVSFSFRSLSKFLKLAASPVFAVMAILPAVYGSELAAVCFVSTSSIIPLGMGTMYALMSIFHIGPWLEMLDTHQGAESDYETK